MLFLKESGVGGMCVIIYMYMYKKDPHLCMCMCDTMIYSGGE